MIEQTTTKELEYVPGGEGIERRNQTSKTLQHFSSQIVFSPALPDDITTIIA